MLGSLSGFRFSLFTVSGFGHRSLMDVVRISGLRGSGLKILQGLLAKKGVGAQREWRTSRTYVTRAR